MLKILTSDEQQLWIERMGGVDFVSETDTTWYPCYYASPQSARPPILITVNNDWGRISIESLTLVKGNEPQFATQSRSRHPREETGPGFNAGLRSASLSLNSHYILWRDAKTTTAAQMNFIDFPDSAARQPWERWSAKKYLLEREGWLKYRDPDYDGDDDDDGHDRLGLWVPHGQRNYVRKRIIWTMRKGMKEKTMFKIDWERAYRLAHGNWAEIIEGEGWLNGRTWV